MQYDTRITLLKQLAKKEIKVACEVGVFKGLYSHKILRHIPTIETLYMVDLWSPQDNYVDNANVAQQKFDEFFEMAKELVKPYKNKVKILKGHSVDMAKHIPDLSLDWCYIDARHDYKGCSEDLIAYWPKVKSGGYISGHDYLTAKQVKSRNPNQDWSVCYDGTINERAVKGAVDDFAKALSRKVFVGNEAWPTWTIEK